MSDLLTYMQQYYPQIAWLPVIAVCFYALRWVFGFYNEAHKALGDIGGIDTWGTRKVKSFVDAFGDDEDVNSLVAPLKHRYVQQVTVRLNARLARRGNHDVPAYMPCFVLFLISYFLLLECTHVLDLSQNDATVICIKLTWFALWMILLVVTICLLVASVLLNATKAGSWDGIKAYFKRKKYDRARRIQGILGHRIELNQLSSLVAGGKEYHFLDCTEHADVLPVDELAIEGSVTLFREDDEVYREFFANNKNRGLWESLKIGELKRKQCKCSCYEENLASYMGKFLPSHGIDKDTYVFCYSTYGLSSVAMADCLRAYGYKWAYDIGELDGRRAQIRRRAIEMGLEREEGII